MRDEVRYDKAADRSVSASERQYRCKTLIVGAGLAGASLGFLLRKAGLFMEVGKRFEVPEGDIAAFTRKVRHDYEREYARIRRERETAAYNAWYVQ